MRCLSRIRTSLKGTFSCQSGSSRPYSFSSEIAQLLNSFEETPSVPPIIPANRKILSEFQQNVANPKVATWFLTKQYNLLHRNSSLRVLPASTANDYLIRLFRERDIKTTVKILLEYNLDEAVLVATRALMQLPFDEKESCLFSLHQGLSNARQSGLMNQIMVELGYIGTRHDAFKRLVIVHENMARCKNEGTLKDVQELCSLLSQRMRGTSSKDGHLGTRTVLALMKQSIQLKTNHFSRELCKHNWHAEEAIQVYLSTLTDSQSVQVLLDDLSMIREQVDSCEDDLVASKIFVWTINKVNDPECLRPLYNLQLLSSSIRSALASRMSKSRSTMRLSVELANTSSPAELANLLSEWTLQLTTCVDGEVANITTAIKELLGRRSSSRSDIMSQYLRIIAHSTNGQLQLYGFRALMRVLQFFDASSGSLSDAVQQQVSKQFVNRPYHETLEYFRMQGTAVRYMEGLIGHHLNLLRNQDRKANPREISRDQADLPDMEHTEDSALIPPPSSDNQTAFANRVTPLQSVEFFVEVFTILRSRAVQSETSYTSEHLASSFENILRNLLQISSSSLAVNFLFRTHKLGHVLPPNLAPYLIRALSLNPTGGRNVSKVLRFYSGKIMTYDIFARYISRISSTDPVRAMATLDLSLEKGHEPRRRMIQNLMLGISRCNTISESRAFRYLVRIMGVATKHGMTLDKIQLSSLLRVVLVRQGLGAATTRLSWLLNLSMELSTQETRSGMMGKSHDELVRVIRKWRIHEEVRGDGTGRLRPRKLREVLVDMSARRSVINTKRLARGKRVPR